MWRRRETDRLKKEEKKLIAKQETEEKEMSNEVKKRTKSGRMRCKRREVSEKHEKRNEEE